jgi:hypothetical protein
MKTKISLILFVLCFTQLSAKTKLEAMDDLPVVRSRPFDRMFSSNPLAMIMGGFELGYEAALTPKQSLVINAGYYLSEEAGFLDVKGDFQDMTGFRLEMQLRFYKKNNNYIKNMFFAPFVNLKTQSAYETTSISLNTPPYRQEVLTKRDATNIGIGYIIGTRKSLYENIYLDLGIGGGVYIPVSGEGHKDLHIGLFSPFRKGVQLKGYAAILIAL